MSGPGDTLASPPSFDASFKREVRAHVARYAKPSTALALRNLVSTLSVYAICLVSLPWLWDHATAGSLVALLLVLLTLVGTQVRAFMLHHDLCHGSFLAQRWANRVLAVFVGALVSTSPSVWSREHDRHHRDSNNLDLEQDGQTASWTTERYLTAPRWQRVLYWLLNQRVVLFVLLPPLYFFGFMRVRAKLVENLVFAGWATLLWYSGLLGWFVLSTALASLVGFLLFHAQHTFDGVLRVPGERWDFFDNGMLGSSFMSLPTLPLVGAVLRWFAYSVEYHHVHHLHPKVAGYRLAACHQDGGPLFDRVQRVTLGDALRTTRYSLYDASNGGFDSVTNHSPW